MPRLGLSNEGLLGSRFFSLGPPLGVAVPAGLPVGLCAGRAARLACDGRCGAVPAFAELLGLPTLFLSKALLVFHALRGLSPGLLVLLALFGYLFSSGLLGRFFIWGSVLYDRSPLAFSLGRAFFFAARLGDARADRGLRGSGNVWWRVILLENSAG